MSEPTNCKTESICFYSQYMFSQSVLKLLGQFDDWKPVLRKLGQILVAVTPDPQIGNYVEVGKIFNNRLHFLNAYLYVNKTGGKSATSPSIETCCALQRLVLLFMGGFLFEKFQNQQSPDVLAKMDKYSFAKTSIETVTQDKKNVLYALGYDVAIYSWLNERPGGFEIVEKKKRGKQITAKTDNIKIVESRMSRMTAKHEMVVGKVGSLESKFEGLSEKFEGMSGQMQQMMDWMTKQNVAKKPKKGKKKKKPLQDPENNPIPNIAIESKTDEQEEQGDNEDLDNEEE